MSEPIRSLTGSPRHSRARVAATFEQGGVVYWGDVGTDAIGHFAYDLNHPQAAFTKNGWLIAAADQECQVYRAQSGQVSLAALCRDTGSSPFAVLHTSYTNQFALCTSDARIRVFWIR